MRESLTEPIPVDLYAARARWHDLLQAVHQGQSFLITRGGHAFATLTPAQPAPVPIEPCPLVDPDTAHRLRILADRYQQETLASLLVLPSDVLTRFIQTGLVSEALFQQITTLEALAHIIFPTAHCAAGRRWLTRPHPKLKHHPPLFTLRRALLQEDDLAATILELARAAFPP